MMHKLLERALTMEPAVHVEQTGPSAQVWQLGMVLHGKHNVSAELKRENHPSWYLAHTQQHRQCILDRHCNYCID